MVLTNLESVYKHYNSNVVWDIPHCCQSFKQLKLALCVWHTFGRHVIYTCIKLDAPDTAGAYVKGTTS